MSRTLPRALKRGDAIGMIGPSGSSKDPGMADKGAAALAALGFEVVVGESCRGKYGYLAAPDELRAADLGAFFADDAIDGIVCMKGGYGAPRILDMIDYALIARHPKVFAGYSDITGLHLALRRYAGFPTFHAPMAVSMVGGFDGFSAASWAAALTTPGPLGLLAPPPGPAPTALAGGKARGPLVGGNLSLVAALTGTPYALEPDGAILFLEDVDEEPYRVDRMLTQLRLAGVFERCAGIVLGHWTRCEPRDPDRSLTLERVFADVILPAGKPVLAGFAAGHSTPTHSFPLGVEAALDADAGTLEIVGASLQ
ncbi:MAG: LD-carboxypeptidase [Spirochaetae bacterium HGW-Spirochaetae-3]|jgi:muramoyltetrapeptide carboxypeptidase|nr:MAG: LD-carboxypeptidase [Spirochaetae bacterium HGW-Spirochaetae-3]